MDKKNITKHYSNGEITVVWQSGKCIHSANCVKNLPQVFNTKESPWVNVANASSEEIIATVNKCPSGALSIIKKE
ncbi:MAG: (4Fe-4S)-binding protein [Flavobacteriales bacterium]|nr:(4Fe-4S)-binding protein [Flavobacteriales bacterium]